jgi:hypothetical protein
MAASPSSAPAGAWLAAAPNLLMQARVSRGVRQCRSRYVNQAATNEDVREFSTDSLVFPRDYTVMQEFQRNYVFEVRYGW